MKLFRSMLRYELKTLTRSKWLISFTLLFLGLSILLYIYGLHSGNYEYSVDTYTVDGVNINIGKDLDPSLFGLDKYKNIETVDKAEQLKNGYNRSISMLINISLWIVPLLCLILGTNSVISDKEEGRYALYRTYHPRVFPYLLSKYTALVLSLWMSMGLSFGSFGLYLAITKAYIDASMFATFLSLNMILVILFSALALFIGSISTKRMQSFSYALFVWSFLIFIYEFILFSILPLIPYAQKLLFLFIMILANPIESLRVWSIGQLGSSYIFGPEFLILSRWGENHLLTIYLSLSVFLLVGIALSLSTVALRKR